MDYRVNEEAMAIREERKEKHRSGDRIKSRIDANVRVSELKKIAKKVESLAGQAANLGEPDLAEDLRTVARFAMKFAAKAKD